MVQMKLFRNQIDPGAIVSSSPSNNNSANFTNCYLLKKLLFEFVHLMINSINYFSIAVLLIISAAFSKAQQPDNSKTGWISKPFENKEFVENIGQYDQNDNLLKDTILFGVNKDGVQIFLQPLLREPTITLPNWMKLLLKDMLH